MKMHAPHGAGFTLVETVLVAAIAVLLVWLLVPALGGARDRAREAVALSDLRQHAQVFHAYAGDFDDTLPFFAFPNATTTILRGSFGAVEMRYFTSAHFWPFALTDGYYEGRPPWGEPFATPFGRGNDEIYAGEAYLYSCSFIAAPPYWRLETREGRHQWRPNRASSVRYPSDKALLSLDAWMRTLRPGDLTTGDRGRDEAVLVAATDGHAERVLGGEIAPGVRTGDGPLGGLGAHVRDRPPHGLHTLDGALGRDLR